MRFLACLLLAAAASADGLVYVGLNAQGAEEWYRPRDGATVVRVPRGAYKKRPYQGGAHDGEPEDVMVESFLIDKYEVTNAQFARFLDAAGVDPKGLVDPRVPGLARKDGRWVVAEGLERYPVTAATGRGAAAFAAWVGGSIPTPTQWEKAAGGPEGRLYPWGHDDPDASRANFGLKGPAPVGSHAAGVSPYGCHDMAGNVYDRVMMGGQPVMIKGGSWLSPHALNLRVLDMCVQPMQVAERSVGFRCAMDDPEPERPTRQAAAPPVLKLAKSWAGAVAEAKKRRVPIFLSLQFDTCGQCDRTRAQLFQDPRFVAYCNAKMVVAVGHRPAPQFGVEEHEENDDGCPLYPGLECADHSLLFKDAIAVVERFRVSPGNFVLHPDRVEQGRASILIRERALPKWGNPVEEYLQAFERARKALDG